jgi:signal transduction histidine kinase
MLKIIILLAGVLFSLSRLSGQQPANTNGDWVHQLSSDDPRYVRVCFEVADSFMNFEKYDSAQLWLNKIHAVLPFKDNSVNNYFLITRQAEVYYYNNLQQLGLQESRRGLAMAEALNDSLLLADSYNFLGLFYMNIDSNAASIPYYEKGLQYIRQRPVPPGYLSLSKPHHLYGNMAEAYYKLGRYDSAELHYRLSLEKARDLRSPRGIAVGEAGLGDVFVARAMPDSALFYYNKANGQSLASDDIDVALYCYAGMARSAQMLNLIASANEYLEKGFDLLRQHPNLNRFFGASFLNTAAEVYKKAGNTTGLIDALEKKSALEEATLGGQNKQIQTILNAGLENEKRLLSMQVQDARQNQKLANSRLLIALAGFAILAIVFFVYRYYQNQKVQVARIRQKISQDLHDDIGASLSSLQIYGEVAEQSLRSQPEKAAEMIRKIKGQSREILDNMADIVWSMRSNNTGEVSLSTKIRNYASELLQDRQIEFSFVIQPEAERALVSMKARKNILLIVRELLNNVAKYSKANTVTLHIYLQDKNWIMDLKDNGIGLEVERDNSGNGLRNIRYRCEELNGVCHIEGKEGTRFMFVFPVNVLNDTGW